MPGNFGCFILIILDFDWKNKLVISMLMMNFEVIVAQYSSLKPAWQLSITLLSYPSVCRAVLDIYALMRLIIMHACF